jgi:hypothetical protein
MSNINFTLAVRETILNGTATILVNNTPPVRAIVDVCHADTGEGLGGSEVDPNGKWQVSIWEDLPVEVYFMVSGEDSNGNWFEKRIDGTIGVNSTYVSDIDLFVNMNTITLSGTANIMVNGVPPQWAAIQAYRDQRADANYIGDSWIDLDDNGSWQMNIESFNAPTEVYLWVIGSDSEGEWFEKTISIGSVYDTSRYDINLTVELSYITLSGTVDMKINGASPDRSDIEVSYATGNGIEYKSGDTDANGNWEIQIWAFDTPTTVNISVRGFIGNARYSGPSVTREVHDSSIGGINFSVDVSGIIRIGGTISFPREVMWFGVEAKLADGTWLGGTWDNFNPWGILINSLGANTTVYFTVTGGYDSNGKYTYFEKENIITATVGNQSVTNINIVVPSF